MSGFFSRLFGRKEAKAALSLTPEEGGAIARQALAAGELRHATFHVGCALAVDAVRPEWRPLFDQIISIALEPLELAPLEKENFSPRLRRDHIFWPACAAAMRRCT